MDNQTFFTFRARGAGVRSVDYVGRMVVTGARVLVTDRH